MEVKNGMTEVNVTVCWEGEFHVNNKGSLVKNCGSLSCELALAWNLG